MADIQLWREAAAEMGLQGPEIIAFVREQQEIGREECRMQREDAQAQAQREEAQAAGDVAQAQAQREHELEVLILRGNRQQDQQNKRNALANGWAEENLAISLGALLTGKALGLYQTLRRRCFKLC